MKKRKYLFIFWLKLLHLELFSHSLKVNLQWRCHQTFLSTSSSTLVLHGFSLASIWLIRGLVSSSSSRYSLSYLKHHHKDFQQKQYKYHHTQYQHLALFRQSILCHTCSLQNNNLLYDLEVCRTLTFGWGELGNRRRKVCSDSCSIGTAQT